MHTEAVEASQAGEKCCKEREKNSETSRNKTLE